MIKISAKVNTTDGIGSLKVETEDWHEAMCVLEGWNAAVGEHIVSIKMEFK